MKMLHHSLVLLTLVFLACCAQEQLTCLRSAASTPSSSFGGNDIFREREQGPPGKKGPVGARGARGQKGSKGEPGATNNAVVAQLRNDIVSLQRQLQSRFSSFQAGFERLSNSWVGLFNGYQYKVSGRRQNYTLSRRFCRQEGADLAVIGIQDPNNRRTIFEALGIGSLKAGAYIGLNDIEREGIFKWLGGRLLSNNGPNFWRGGRPDGGERQDCVVIGWADDRISDVNCRGAFHTLCEKRWS